MTTRLLQMPDGRLIEVDMDRDTALFIAPRNNATEGLDLFLHEAEEGQFYFFHWSTQTDAAQRVELVTSEAARQFLIDRCALIGPGSLTAEQITLANRVGLNLRPDVR